MSRGTGLYGTGRKASAMKADHQSWADEQPAVTRCAFCKWTFTGSAFMGRHAAAAHRADTHPEIRPKRTRRRTLQRFHLGDQFFRLEGNIRAAEVAAMLAHREGEAA